MTSRTPESPDFLTVEEAARVLRIGRTAAYALARVWRATDGREGLPVVSFGRLLRVPRAALEQIAGGSISMPASDALRSVMPASDEPNPQPPRPTTPRPRSTRNTDVEQPTLPLT